MPNGFSEFSSFDMNELNSDTLNHILKLGFRCLGLVCIVTSSLRISVRSRAAAVVFSQLKSLSFLAFSNSQSSAFCFLPSSGFYSIR